MEACVPFQIYIHIPFCVRKCNYCDFLSFPAEKEIQEQYFDSLRQEILSFEDTKGREVVSVFFGGGTPSLPDPALIISTLDLIRSGFRMAPDAEITLECNPGTLSPGNSSGGEAEPDPDSGDKLVRYRRAGINRLSLGLQSADNGLLRTLGRIHSFEQFEREYRKARQAGFDNISVDLMYGLPGQTPQIWDETLDRVLALDNGTDQEKTTGGERPAGPTGKAAGGERPAGPMGKAAGVERPARAGEKAAGSIRTRRTGPEHISAYSLIIEEGTPFYERYREDAQLKSMGEKPLFLTSEEEEGKMLRDLKEKLHSAGMHRYEISNYARDGYESRHNSGYWLRRQYAGFGLGASSQIGSVRYKNTDDLSRYLAGDFSKREMFVLSKDNEIEETMFLGLRMTRGVDLEDFERKFRVSALTVYAEQIPRLQESGLIELKDGRLFLTERGTDVSNLVMAEFLLD